MRRKSRSARNGPCRHQSSGGLDASEFPSSRHRGYRTPTSGVDVYEVSDGNMEDGSPVTRPLGPRNLPRASHACQRCRIKKGRCNQQQPCSSCVRANTSCIYGEERRKRRKKNGDQPEGSLEQDDTQLQPTPGSAISPDTGSITVRGVTEDVPNEVSRRDMTSEVNVDSVRSGMSSFVRLALQAESDHRRSYYNFQ